MCLHFRWNDRPQSAEFTLSKVPNVLKKNPLFRINNQICLFQVKSGEKVGKRPFLGFLINPFAPEPPVIALADPRPFYPLWRHQFYQGQLCPLTCAEWRDLSNPTRMNTIQSRTPEKEAKNHVTLTWKSPWKSCSITHLTGLKNGWLVERLWREKAIS